MPNLIRNKWKNRGVLSSILTMQMEVTDNIGYNPGCTDGYPQDYLLSFKLMASYGFYSFDRSNLENPYDFTCHLVAWPQERNGGCRLIANLDLPIVESEIFQIGSFQQSYDMWKILSI